MCSALSPLHLSFRWLAACSSNLFILFVGSLCVSQLSLGLPDNDYPALVGQDGEIACSEERTIENFEEGLIRSEVSSLVQMQRQSMRNQLERETPKTPFCYPAPSLLQLNGERSTKGVAAYPMKLCYIAQVEEAMPAPHYLPNPWLLKYPRSWVERIFKLGSKKEHSYSFVGSVCREEWQFEARKWVLSFAAQNFANTDFLKATDCTGDDEQSRRYRLLGTFDHTFDNYTSQVPSLQQAENIMEMPDFDESYWKVMARSNFTLAPAGDSQYSYRFYEAMLAGSIPIVLDVNHTWGLEGQEASEKIGWNYYVLSHNADYIYRQDWADDNLAKAIKYLTYLEGDNHP